jgi:hypothetical protein
LLEFADDYSRSAHNLPMICLLAKDPARQQPIANAAESKPNARGRVRLRRKTGRNAFALKILKNKPFVINGLA